MTGGDDPEPRICASPPGHPAALRPPWSVTADGGVVAGTDTGRLFFYRIGGAEPQSTWNAHDGAVTGLGGPRAVRSPRRRRRRGAALVAAGRPVARHPGASRRHGRRRGRRHRRRRLGLRRRCGRSPPRPADRRGRRASRRTAPSTAGPCWTTPAGSTATPRRSRTSSGRRTALRSSSSGTPRNGSNRAFFAARVTAGTPVITADTAPIGGGIFLPPQGRDLDRFAGRGAGPAGRRYGHGDRSDRRRDRRCPPVPQRQAPAGLRPDRPAGDGRGQSGPRRRDLAGAGGRWIERDPCGRAGVARRGKARRRTPSSGSTFPPRPVPGCISFRWASTATAIRSGASTMPHPMRARSPTCSGGSAGRFIRPATWRP